MSRMPVLFVGHGSPMNALEDNSYTQVWKQIAERIPRPAAILSVSAHWFVQGTRIMNGAAPGIVFDMYGFPKELYEVRYSPPGSPEVAAIAERLIPVKTEIDNSWGIDHGTWSVLVHMYPKGDIPVFQISIDADAPPEAHFKIGRSLAPLRDQGVLLFGTGNVVHNLRRVDWGMAGKGFDWAHAFDDHIHATILQKNHDRIVRYKEAGEMAQLAVPTPDHYIPLLYTVGAASDADRVEVFNRSCELGSLSMTGYLWTTP